MNKKTIIILSVLVLFLIIGGVSASETNTTDEKVSTTDTNDVISSTDEILETEDNFLMDLCQNEEIYNSSNFNENNLDKLEFNKYDVLSISNENNILKDTPSGNWTELTNLLNSATAGSVVHLEKDYIKVSGESNIHLNKKLIIDGGGHTISGNNIESTCVPAILGSDSCFKNCNFIKITNYLTTVSTYNYEFCNFTDSTLPEFFFVERYSTIRELEYIKWN